MKLNNVLKLIIAISVCEIAGVIGSVFTVSAIPVWYAGLAKPAFNPPSWVFGPAWTTLYFLMGVAAFLVWKKGIGRKDAQMALGVFGVQLFLNAIWSIIFFGLKNPGWAFLDIVLLWFAIVGTIIVFHKISRKAALLLLPYLLWVSFAGYLNYSIWQLQTPPIKLYYYNQELDRDESGNIACSREGLAPVEREIPITQTPIQDAIKLLLSGELTDKERAQGIDSEYPLEGLSLKGALLRDGILTLEFDDAKNKTVGGSCRVGILWFQIEATAKQFPEVQQVRFLPEEIFQP